MALVSRSGAQGIGYWIAYVRGRTTRKSTLALPRALPKREVAVTVTRTRVSGDDRGVPAGGT